MAVMKTWLYNSNNQQVAPNTTIDQIMMEDGISSFKEQYDADIAEAKGRVQGIDTTLTQPGAAADAKALDIILFIMTIKIKLMRLKKN